MVKKVKSLIAVVLFGCIAVILSGCDMAILDPKGVTALEERNLIFTALGLMLIVVIPTFIMTIVFARKYRASNVSAKYDPTFTHSTIIEVICWGIPCIIIAILGTITWISTHKLDPYRPLDSNIKPITIEVVALDWKWLFIYPEQKIATVNLVQFPVNVPVTFKITADAPMNSLWIPQLSGQVYAMAGMQTKLHIMATEVGDYRGSAANISGAGFSGMKFIARVSNQSEFDKWVNTVQNSHEVLTGSEYIQLAKPSEDNPVKYYGMVRDRLFDDIIMKYMMPGVDLAKDSGHLENKSTESMASM
ncbi:MAG: ubiquinol oxidase subunit II [Neisseriaceae bacterium]